VTEGCGGGGGSRTPVPEWPSDDVSGEAPGGCGEDRGEPPEERGLPCGLSGPFAAPDQNLSRLVSLWPELPEEVKSEILARAEAATPGGQR